MKRLLAVLGLMFLLPGCTMKTDPMHHAMQIRDRLLSSDGCSFSAEVTADYGKDLYTFSMDCQSDRAGDVAFTVTAPDELSSISGRLSQEGGALTFEDTALHFELLTDDQLSPVSAPWIFVRTLRGGCITSACMEEDMLHIIADDSYEDDALTLDIWLDGEDKPVRADILYDGKRILSLNVESFVIA